ncbi:class I SAM-dependent methyltransferase [Mesorhizobium escarrei]|uniref:2-polyprenyl-6-hydroxyphenol methylase n=1 Tax=Mesorhizobium escarrei TaxID=666018 RepID=A0ABN8K846_9HYPH|nr:class I SAM-dependent methyltransferase [Mesorhizobium escarrei]CAH2406451.1 putative 2-polyprenyl-6-hydroxyphenol methylase [Mesorhizobium escarrei]
MSQEKNLEYLYDSHETNDSHNILLPAVDRIVKEFSPATIFDLGCGNGSVAKHLSGRCEVTGIDPSISAVAVANKAYPEIRIESGSAYDDLRARYGTFDMVLSLEVVEHLYDPRAFARNVYELLNPGGTAVISTPYHGYIKNLALAVTGRMDAHFWALWDGGHIKFWSIRTLGILLKEVGLKVSRFERVGRIPALAKSMIVIAQKPK